jgi:hypothetical protein
MDEKNPCRGYAPQKRGWLPVLQTGTGLRPSDTKCLSVNIRLEILRHYFRLCYDLGLYNSLKYKDFAERLDEIGRMTGGWLKSLK